MTNAAAECASITNSQMRNVLHRVMQHRNVLLYQDIRCRHSVPNQSTNCDSVFAKLNFPDIRNVIDVYQNGWLNKPEIHHWHQTLTSGNDLAVTICSAKNFDGMPNAFRTNIIE